MLLLGALLALLAAGLWMFALMDVLLTPALDCRHLSKASWLVVTAVAPVIGALAWLTLGRRYAPVVRYRHHRGTRRWYAGWRGHGAGIGAEEALRRHPAGRARDDWTAESLLADLAAAGPSLLPPMRAAGPDDDPDFLRYLDQIIRDIREAGNGA